MRERLAYWAIEFISGYAALVRCKASQVGVGRRSAQKEDVMVEVQTAKVQTIQQLGQQLRVDSIRCTTEAGSGHPSSSMSAADLMAVLMAKYLKYDFSNPKAPNNDHLIM